MKKVWEEMTLEELWELFPIILKPYDPSYQDWYREEAQNLARIVESWRIFRINHIGSTAVAGLLAKPTVDILLELHKNSEIKKTAKTLQKNGWILMNEQKDRMTLNKGYTPKGFDKKVFHLHVRPAGDWDELYFRDYLRQETAVRAEYAKLKQELAYRFEHDRDGYTNAKTEFVKRYTQEARACFSQRYLPHSNEL